VGGAEAEAGAMGVADVPVQLEAVLLTGGVGRHVAAEHAGVHAVTGGDVAHAGDVVLGDANDVRGTGTDRAERRARRAHLVVLVVEEEEQAILDQRATEGHAPGGLVLEAAEVAAVLVVADHRVVAPQAVDAAVELVGVGLGDGDDHAAGTAVDGEVVVGDVDGHFLDDVHRERLARGRQAVRLKAEGVVGADAVDADDVVARVLAADEDLVARLLGLDDARVEAGVVLQAALDRREGLDLVAGDVGAGTHLLGAEHVGAGGADHLDGLQLGDIGAGQVDIDGGELAQDQVHVLLHFALESVTDHGDGVRAADAQAAGVVTAAGIGGGTRGGARGSVDDDHLGAGNRLTLFGGHHTAEGGGGLL